MKLFGITEFVNTTTQKFKGDLKTRASDFQVFEIDLLGRSTHLCKNTSQKKGMVELENLTKNTSVSESIELLLKEGLEFEIFAPYDKMDRFKIHQLVATHFDGLVATTTKDDVIVFQKKESEQRVSKIFMDYCHFTLYKSDRDTMDCVNFVSKLSKIPTKSFTYAGTKDRRSISAQRVCVYKTKIAKLESLNSELKNMVLGDFLYSNERLMLGDLLGNSFKIALRNVTSKRENDQSLQDFDHSAIQESFRGLRDNGFINYFGLQRFGTRTIATYELGIAMLAHKWQDAIGLVLNYREEDIGDEKNARLHWNEHKDPAAAQKLFPYRCVAERAILNSYVKQKNPNGHLTALQAVPRNLRMMYLHSYQSYVWNEVQFF